MFDAPSALKGDVRVKIKVTDQKGAAHEIEGTNGWTLMEVVRQAGLPMKAECGGCLACATCHVYVEGPWFAKLPDVGEVELSMLDMAFDIQENSRLACQITLTPEHDGLTVTLAPGTD
jgi:ferredoxin, 2Fe-2S